MTIKKFNLIHLFLFLTILSVASSCSKDDANAKIFDKYFQLPENPVKKDAVRDGSPLAVGINAYFMGDYLGSKNALKPLVENQNSVNLEAYYFYAHSFLATGDYDMAVKYFEAAQERLIHHIAQPAQWYSALALIKKGDRADAKKILKDIVTKSNHKYYTKAQELLKEL